MTDLPHVFAGQKPTEEHIRIFEAYRREHDMPWIGQHATAAMYNTAIDWWNNLQASPAAGLYCLDPECDCRDHGAQEELT